MNKEQLLATDNMEAFNTTYKLSNCIKSAPFISNCDHLIRLSESLKFYAHLDLENDKSDRDKLVNFIENIYNGNDNEGKTFLNDYIHLVTEHGEDLEYIHSELIKRNDFPKCSLKDCVLTCRHHKGREGDYKINDNEDDEIINDESLCGFYIDTMDSLHYYLLHLFDIGLRIKSNQYKQQLFDDQKENNNDLILVDESFAILKKTIEEKRKQYNEKFGRFQSSKFNINIQNNQNQQMSEETLWMEEIFEEISKNEVTENEKQTFFTFLNEEEYDSDAVEDDICDDVISGSNITNHMNNNNIAMIINKYIQYIKLLSGSFSIGLRFYYWPYYRDLEKLEYMGHSHNIFDHHGYKIKDLFIGQKCKSFKEEILEYGYININEYKELVILRANEYIYSDRAKNTKAIVTRYDPKYDIPNGTSLSVSNLISVILYTDFSDLSTDFSSTFRKTKPTESLSSIKHKHRKYWWLSKTLRETVECYGFRRHEKWKNPEYKGPFYCGMSFVMVCPEINIRLCSPISTSKHIEVATKFSGRDGIIITFNNEGAEIPARLLRFLDCSWISKFKEEDERLIFGGGYTIGIENIRIVEGNKNYENLFRTLTYFDCMLVGSLLSPKYKGKCSIKDRKSISILIANELGIAKNVNLDQYIADTFHLYCNKKTSIRINLNQLNTSHFEKIRSLICHSIKKEEHNFDINNIEEESTKNLLNDVVFKLFKNVTTFVVQCGAWNSSYPFPVISLLKIWHSVSVMDQIKLEALKSLDDDDSWLYKLWSSSKFQSSIQNQPYTVQMSPMSDTDEQSMLIKRVK